MESHYVAQVGLEILVILTIFKVLGFQVCTNISHVFPILNLCFILSNP